MILADSSVWIDLFNDRRTPQTEFFERLSEARQVFGVGDIVLMEVLQGTRGEKAFDRTLARLALFDTVAIVDQTVAIAAARNYRVLRSRGITIRKTIDTLIATRCILDGLPLLYSDRDFDPFVEHLGLVSAMTDFTGVT